MSESPIHVPPRAFISYSWTNPAHEAWVLDLAIRLTKDGIDIILDKWELRPGHDSYAFMESMVTDPSVTKVIMICDQAYVQKANARAGGVGTEGQIISPELYGKVAQDKYAALVTEVDERGHRHVPMFYKGRIYFDFVSVDAFEVQYEALLRWLADKPLFVKPAVGRLPEKILAPVVALEVDAPAKVALVSEVNKAKSEDRAADEAKGRSALEIALKEVRRARNQGELDKAMLLALGGWAVARINSDFSASELVHILADLALADSEIFVFSDHRNKVRSIEFSPDGSAILTGSHDCTANFYSAHSGKLIEKIEITESSGIYRSSFSRDGKYIIVSSQIRTFIYDISSGHKYEKHMSVPWDLSFDRRYIIACTGDEIYKCNFPSEGFEAKLLAKDSSIIKSLTYSSNSKFILIGNSDGCIKIIDAFLGDVTFVRKYSNYSIEQAILSPDDNFIAFAVAGSLRILKNSNFDSIGNEMRYVGSCRSLMFSPDESRLLISTDNGIVQLWSTSTKKLVGGVMKHDAPLFEAKFSADGKRIVTASRNCARLWNGLTGAPIGAPIEHPDSVNIVTFSPDGQTILTACDDYKVRLWDISSTYLEGDALIEHICRHHLIDDQEFTDAELRASMIPDLPRNPVAACLAWLEQNRSAPA